MGQYLRSGEMAKCAKRTKKISAYIVHKVDEPLIIAMLRKKHLVSKKVKVHMVKR